MSEGSFVDAGALGDVFPGNRNAKISELQCCVHTTFLSPYNSVPTFIYDIRNKIIKLLIFEFYWDSLNTEETLLRGIVAGTSLDLPPST
jgi:hypothetical protein